MNSLRMRFNSLRGNSDSSAHAMFKLSREQSCQTETFEVRLDYLLALDTRWRRGSLSSHALDARRQKERVAAEVHRRNSVFT